MLPPPLSFEAYQAQYSAASQNPDAYWADVAMRYHWFAPWHAVRSGGFAQADMRWFDGGTTNLAHNCVARHLPHLAYHTAIFWEPIDPA